MVDISVEHTMRDRAGTAAPDLAVTVTNTINWSAVFGGVVVALAVQILLNMLGAGVGAALGDATIDDDALAAALAWWTISGVIAAFAGGFAAGLLARLTGAGRGSLHAFISWCTTTALVLIIAAVLAGATSGNDFAGPAGAVSHQIQTARGHASSEEIRDLRDMLAHTALWSFIALCVGAIVATFAGHLGRTSWYRTFRR